MKQEKATTTVTPLNQVEGTPPGVSLPPYSPPRLQRLNSSRVESGSVDFLNEGSFGHDSFSTSYFGSLYIS